jgi:hypothetical protein
VKRYGKYRRKLWDDLENMEENSEKICVSSIFFLSFHYSPYLSSIFSLFFHYSTYFSSIISKSFHNFLLYETQAEVKIFGKYGRKLWNDMENMEEKLAE